MNHSSNIFPSFAGHPFDSSQSFEQLKTIQKEHTFESLSLMQVAVHKQEEMLTNLWSCGQAKSRNSRKSLELFLKSENCFITIEEIDHHQTKLHYYLHNINQHIEQEDYDIFKEDHTEMEQTAMEDLYDQSPVEVFHDYEAYFTNTN